MKKVLIVLLSMAVFVTLAMAQNPNYTSGDGLHGIDKLGAHQNGGKGCVGCHAPHSGARGNGGNAAAGGGAVTDADTGNFALWGQDLSPLYGQTLYFGDEDSVTKKGSFDVTFGANFAGTEEQVITGVMMCLSCHDGNLAKGAMMANASYEQSAGLLPPNTYGPQTIPTLLGNDGTAAGNYKNDHPIGPKANLGAVGVAGNFLYKNDGTCTSHGAAIPCLQPDPAAVNYVAFINHYGSFSITASTKAYPAGGRSEFLVLPDTNPNNAYLVCTSCHTPHSMYVFSGTAGGVKGTYPTYFFLIAPYNPAAPIPDGTKASSATQFCRQCHFTGAGGANEGSGIMNVTTSF